MVDQSNQKRSLDAFAKDESTNSVAASSDEDSGLRPYITTREKIRSVMTSHRFQVGIIVLVIFDCLLVIAELMLDVRILELHQQDHLAPHILHYMSIGILSIFIVEITVKVYALGLEFFQHKLEVFDALVVFLSFALDVSFREEESVKNGFGLVIIMRLWRVARILNGVVISVKHQSEHKLMKERALREGTEQELQRCKEYANALENEINILRQFLKQNGINELPPTVVENTFPAENTIRIVAEVNHNQPTDNV